MAVLTPRINLPLPQINIAIQRSGLSLPSSIEVDTPNAVPPAILRGGVQVVPPVVDDTKANDFISNLIPINRTLVPRVVSQSVPANTRVAVGTNVDLVLVGIIDIRIGILDGTRSDLAQTAISQILQVVQDPQVAPILQQTTDPTTLTDAQKAVITNSFVNVNNVGAIDETNPAINFAATFATLQSVRSFE